MTLATFRSAAEHIARTGTITPHQLAAWEAAWEAATNEQRQAFTQLWRAAGSPAAAHTPEPGNQNLQSWLTYLTSDAVLRESSGKIRPLTLPEACGFIGCIIVETGRPWLDRLDVIEAGSGAGRGAMQYTGVRRTAYDEARSAAIAKGLDPNSNSWQQQYFAEEYAGLHDPAQGSLIGWTRIFENRPAGMDPAKAAAYWTGSAATKTGYFRPGVPHLDRRQQEAQRVWRLVQSGALKSAAIETQQQPAKSPTKAERTQWVTRIKALNLSQPDASTCQAACIGMAVGDRDVAGIRRKLVARGTAGDTTVMGAVIREYGRPYKYEANASLAQCYEWLKAGEFLITHGYFTGSGHVICLDGLKQGSNADRYLLDVKDPWSEFNTKSWSYDLGGKFFDGLYSDLLIYAACVASNSVHRARASYIVGKVDVNRGGMWVHRFLTA
jgi:hypothetical protein